MAPDGTAYVLLNEPPWILRYGLTGPGEPLDLKITVPTGFGIYLDRDTLVVLSSDPSGVVPQRFDATGALLGTGQPLANTAAVGYAEQVGVVAVTDGTEVTVFALDSVNSFHPLVAFASSGQASCVGGGAGGRIIVTGEMRASGMFGIAPWVAQISSSGTLIAQGTITDWQVASFPACVAVDPAGRSYAYWLMNTAINGNGDWRTYIARLGATGGAVWTEYVDGQDPQVVALSDGLLIANASRFFHYSWRGDEREIFSTVEVASPHDITMKVWNGSFVALLGSDTSGHVLSRIVIEPKYDGAGVAGAPCAANEECGSGRCCLPAGSVAGTCSAGTTCGYLSACGADSECEQGTCFRPSGASHGVCTRTCEASAECVGDSFCVRPPCPAGPQCMPICFPECLNAGTSRCTAIDPQLGCALTSDVSGVTVNVCEMAI